MRTVQRLAVQADGRGRLLLPRELRERLGLRPKGAVNVEARDDGSVVLRDPRTDRARRLQAAQGSYAGKGRPVDEFIADRRAEAEREARRR